MSHRVVAFDVKVNHAMALDAALLTSLSEVPSAPDIPRRQKKEN